MCVCVCVRAHTYIYLYLYNCNIVDSVCKGNNISDLRVTKCVTNRVTFCNIVTGIALYIDFAALFLANCAISGQSTVYWLYPLTLIADPMAKTFPHIMLEVNANEAYAKLRKQFAMFSDGEFNRRFAALLNEAVRGAAVEAGRSIRERFPGIKLKMIRDPKKQIIRRASSNNLTAVLTTKGSPIPISKLSPTITKKGISYKLTNSRQHVAAAFMGKGKGSTVLAFARGKYVKPGNSGFAFAEKKGPRKPMDAIKTVSVPGSMMTSQVNKRLNERVGRDLEKRAVNVLTNALARRK